MEIIHVHKLDHKCTFHYQGPADGIDRIGWSQVTMLRDLDPCVVALAEGVQQILIKSSKNILEIPLLLYTMSYFLGTCT